MTLLELKKYFESMRKDRNFDYCLSYPFCWRASYFEIAFAIEKKECKASHILLNIYHGLNNIFVGWKGGNYAFNKDTKVNFENGYSEWTDGQYMKDWIVKLGGSIEVPYLEAELLRLAFPNPKLSFIQNG